MPDTEIIREAARDPYNSEKLAYALTEIVHFMNEINVRLGDLEDEIEGTYDAIWISHILHAEGPGTCKDIIKKSFSALNQGGLLLIHEFILNNDMFRNTFVRINFIFSFIKIRFIFFKT